MWVSPGSVQFPSSYSPSSHANIDSPSNPSEIDGAGSFPWDNLFLSEEQEVIIYWHLIWNTRNERNFNNKKWIKRVLMEIYLTQRILIRSKD